MSKAHTNRRKSIAKLKRQYPDDWFLRFRDHADAIRKVNEGPFIGTLEDILNGSK